MSLEPSPMDLSALSPEQAAAKLTEMTAAASPAPPITPATAADARRRLDALSADQSWGKRFIDGDVAARQEFAELTTQAAGGDHVADALTGTASSDRVFETTMGGELPRRHVDDFISSMRDLGIPDGAIEEALTGKAFSRREHEAVATLQRIKHGDAEWVKRFLTGGAAEMRESWLMAIVLASPIKEP